MAYMDVAATDEVVEAMRWRAMDDEDSSDAVLGMLVATLLSLPMWLVLLLVLRAA